MLEVIAAVLAGNLLSAAFLAAMSKALREQAENPSWLTLAGLFLPLLFLLSMVIIAEGPPPFLAALAPP